MTEEPISEDLATYEDWDEVVHVYNLLDETLRKDHLRIILPSPSTPRVIPTDSTELFEPAYTPVRKDSVIQVLRRHVMQ